MLDIKAALASMRPVLWMGISLNVLASTIVLGIAPSSSIYIAISLCLSSSFSFLINDLLDREIDRHNNVLRPYVSVWWSVSIGLVNVAFVIAPSFIPVFTIGHSLVTALLAVFVIAALYSMVFARFLLVKNFSASLLATSPLWVGSFGALHPPSHLYLAIVLAFGLCIVAREIKFDQFDAFGDRIGGRTTLPHVLPTKSIDSLERVLTLVGTGILLYVAFQKQASFSLAVIPAFLAVAIGLALYIPLREKRDNSYTTITRVAMIISPLYVVNAL